ncbi:YdiU family protein [Acetobacterium sp.]|uniref:protein adenylyltransferase SelO n=1 Tax=Acetobacterium sp. TaxID=1872094 RepID=UPI000CC29116|nr:YdiU family protein [Acetobacterium sp.]MDO9490929.1 YdiU family protein [Acetobacterium sp.]PKM75338.1 MAG: YdiU family protein [Firmicutes bacterium HGW-Firmicutes-17]
MEKNDIGWNLENSYAKLPELFYTPLELETVSAPKLVILNQLLAKDIGLDSEALMGQDGINILAGQALPANAKPIAQAYAGHQFGYFTMLGDGRAMLIGEQITPAGERLDIQLKGSGKTPYSRSGDGRAALGPMLREYLISEAMHYLGIPTSRSLAVVTTGDPVYRENPLKGAVLTRVAASHLRVGTFEYAAQWGTVTDVKALADYAINRHFPLLASEQNVYLGLLDEVIKAQAALIAKWQLVGFIHGVMNTDNVTISGETIDYGPCAFMDHYDPETVFSSIDLQGRYAYRNQPNIGLWNLARLAETLIPLIDDNQEQAIKLVEASLRNYPSLFQADWLQGMRLKLGIVNKEPQDELLIAELLGLMKQYQADYTNTFIDLTLDRTQSTELYESDAFKDWLDRWKARLERPAQTDQDIKKLMQQANPVVIPRNYQVEKVLQAATDQDDFKPLQQLLAVLQSPYDYNSLNQEFMTPPEPSNRPYKTYCGT